MQRRRAEGYTNSTINHELKVIRRTGNVCRARFRVDHRLEVRLVKRVVRLRIITPAEEAEIVARLTHGAETLRVG